MRVVAGTATALCACRGLSACTASPACSGSLGAGFGCTMFLGGANAVMDTENWEVVCESMHWNATGHVRYEVQ